MARPGAASTETPTSPGFKIKITANTLDLRTGLRVVFEKRGTLQRCITLTTTLTSTLTLTSTNPFE